jgi:hypothetical protein
MNGSKTPLIHDLVATDGRAIRRGYLELTLDEYHGDGASDVDASGKPFDTILLYLIDSRSKQEQPIDTLVFASKIPNNISDDERRHIVVGLMNHLSDKCKVSTFTDTFENYDTELKEFKDYCSLAEPAWFS